MERETLQEFKRRSKIPANGKREYSITNSWGVYDFYKYYRKNRPKDSKWALTEGQYYTLFRRINELLVDNLVRTGVLEFPHNMGELIVIKSKRGSWVNEKGKRVTNRGVNWDKTLELWYNDKKAYENKTVIYHENEEISLIKYIKGKAKFKNKYYYGFKPNRDIERRIRNESVVSTIMNRAMLNQINGLYDG